MVFSAKDFSARQMEMAERMDAKGIDWLYISPGSDFRYLTGMEAGRSERPHALVLSRQGERALLCPAFEADYLSGISDIENLLAWEEHQDPFAVFAEHCRKSNAPMERIGLGPQADYGEFVGLQVAFDSAAVVPATALIRGMRVIKSDTEMRVMRDAAARTERVLDEALASDFAPGITERELASRIVNRGLESGLHTASATVLSGPNSSFPHGRTGDRPIDEGEVVFVDFVTTRHGYHADITQTVVFGQPDPRALEIYSVVQEAARRAASAVVPGALAQEIDRSARGVIDRAGYGAHFTHRLGHGLGLDVHEDPYLVEGNDGQGAPAYSHADVHAGKLMSDMVMTIEPAIYIRGELGIRIEDDVAVGDAGCEPLTGNVDKDLARF